MIPPIWWVWMFKTGPSESITLRILEVTPWCLGGRGGRKREFLNFHFGHLHFVKIIFFSASFHSYSSTLLCSPATLLQRSRDAGWTPTKFLLLEVLHARLHWHTSFLLAGTQTLCWRLHYHSLLPRFACLASQLSPLTTPSHFLRLVPSLLNIFECFCLYLP